MSFYKFNNNIDPIPTAAGPGARKGEGRMDDVDVQRVVSALITDAESLVDGELSQDRAKANDYYFGEPFGNEEEGRSQVVLTEVRDTVLGTMPSLLRIVFGPDRVVELQARTPKGVDGAKQATDYAEYVFTQENPGFLITDDVLKDGLIRRIGIYGWEWEEGRVTSHAEDDVTPERLQALAGRDEVEFTEIKSDEESGLFEVEYTVKAIGKLNVFSVPPEEFLFNRNAKSLDNALIIGRRQDLPKGDLIALGVKPEIIDAHGGEDDSLKVNVEATHRKPDHISENDPEAGEANRLIKYVCVYARLDVDGDGFPELRQICTIGSGNYVVSNIPADEIPFAVFTPYREPHSIIGQSQADLAMQMQLVKSMTARTMLDSFVLSVYPRVTVLEGSASIEDVLNNEIGAPIRVKRENAVTPFKHEFTGQNALPLLDYFSQVTENATGRNKGAAGLDADALQSSTKQAVGAAVQASQEQLEMLARMFCEQALKPLFRGIYRQLVKHQDRAKVVKLSGQYVEVNPAQWEADMDVVVNVAQGISQTETRLAALAAFADKQENILQMLGLNNPMVSLGMYRDTLARGVELSGFPGESAKFFRPIDPNWAPPPQPPQPTPDQVLAQTQMEIEKMRTAKDLQIKQAELQMKQQQQQFDQELKVKEMAQDAMLRLYEINAKYKAEYTQMQLDADTERNAAELQGSLDVRRQMHDEAMAQHERALAEDQQAHDQQLAEQQQAHEQQMAQQQAAAASETE